MPPDPNPAVQADDPAQLRAALEAERQRSAALEAETANLRGRVNEYSTRLSGEVTGRLSAEEIATDNAIAAADTEIKQLKADKVRLLQEGKFEEAADLDERMADAVARRNGARSYKEDIGRRRQEAERAPPSREQQIETWLNQNGFSAAEKAWVYRNPRFIDDANFRREVANAYNEALSRGAAKDTPDLFRQIESRVYGARTPSSVPSEAVSSAAAPPGAEAAPAPGPQEEEPGEAPHLVIESASSSPASRGGAMPSGQIPDDARPQNPQPRAAGRGDGASLVNAAAPSRRVPGLRPSEGNTIKLTAEEFDFAQQFASTVAPEIFQQGPEQIALWWHRTRQKPSLQKKLEAYNSQWGAH